VRQSSPPPRATRVTSAQQSQVAVHFFIKPADDKDFFLHRHTHSSVNSFLEKNFVCSGFVKKIGVGADFFAKLVCAL